MSDEHVQQTMRSATGHIITISLRRDDDGYSIAVVAAGIEGGIGCSGHNGPGVEIMIDRALHKVRDELRRLTGVTS